jgi:tetratricopeptide (TPR) repeat protein
MRNVVLLLFLFRGFLLPALAPGQQAEADRLFGAAVEAQQQGDLPTAISDYGQLLKLRPKMVEARVNLGAALAQSGQFDEAIAQYRLALPDVPDKNAVEMDIGLAYYKKGDLENASREFKTVRKARPKDPQLAILLGDSEVRLGRGPEAAAMLAPLESANSGNPDFEYVMGAGLIASGSRREGVERLEKVAEATQGADAYLLAGSTLLEMNELARARKDLEAAQRLNPRLPRIDALVGMARDKTGDQAGAEPEFRAALKIDPDDFDANLYLGAILYKRRDVDEAKPYLDKALALQPTSTIARYELAMWKSTSGQYADAAKDLEQIEKEDPTWLDPHVELATVYYRLHRPADGAKEREIVAKLMAEQQSKGPGKQ